MNLLLKVSRFFHDLHRNGFVKTYTYVQADELSHRHCVPNSRGILCLDYIYIFPSGSSEIRAFCEFEYFIRVYMIIYIHSKKRWHCRIYFTEYVDSQV